MTGPARTCWPNARGHSGPSQLVCRSIAGFSCARVTPQHQRAEGAAGRVSPWLSKPTQSEFQASVQSLLPEAHVSVRGHQLVGQAEPFFTRGAQCPGLLLTNC